MLKKILDYFLAFIFHFIPRDSHLWLTGRPDFSSDMCSMPKFFDNSKYFYLYLVNNTNEKVYWLSSSEKEIALLKSMNLPVLKYNSVKGIYLTLRARYFFHHYGANQINPRLQFGSVNINLWHGTPIKKIGYDIVDRPKYRFIYKFLNKYSVDYFCSTSNYLSERIFSNAFDIPVCRCLNFGYPRTDILNKDKIKIIEFCKKYSFELLPLIDKCEKFSKTFLYMPTWRDDDPLYFKNANIDLEKLNNKLKELNYVVFLKLHPLTEDCDVGNYSNIFQIGNDVDIYPFLNFTDFLITDYSSIYFDYLNLDKEIIFIPYDYENYIKNRALYFNYDEITPGIKYKTFDDFISNLDNICDLDFSEQRNNLKNLVVDSYNFSAAEKIYNYVRNKTH